MWPGPAGQTSFGGDQLAGVGLHPVVTGELAVDAPSAVSVTGPTT